MNRLRPPLKIREWVEFFLKSLGEGVDRVVCRPDEMSFTPSGGRPGERITALGRQSSVSVEVIREIRQPDQRRGLDPPDTT